MKYRLKHVAEYVAVLGLSRLLNALSYRGALAFAWVFSAIIFVFIRARVRAATGRIRQVFGDRFSPRETRSIAWRSWRNFFFTIVESARSPSMTREWIDAVSDFSSETVHLLDHLATGCGAIVAVPHMGSWELAGTAARRYGIDIFSIAARQRNPLTDRYLNQMREAGGIRILTRGSSTLRQVIRELRAGKVFAILPDVRLPAQEVSVHFLGHTANVGAGMALFAYHAEVPVFPCVMTRVGWSRHHFTIHAPIWPNTDTDKQTEIRRMTQTVFDVLNTAVQDQPDQWFWFNKRWVLDPLQRPETPSAALPPEGAPRGP